LPGRDDPRGMDLDFLQRFFTHAWQMEHEDGP
jgi:hypothetical protein